jgi:hypothetical protein
MCEFFTQHGEGRKWYLAMSNYSNELLADKSRTTFLDKVPWLRYLQGCLLTRGHYFKTQK